MVSRPAAEYRLVTIFFADVVGSTTLTGEFDAETARLIFDRSLQMMSNVIDEYGGTVTRLMGDGLLAFFGAPVAHEDDPERASHAALEIHRAIEAYGKELGIPLQVRIGINTGQVVTGDVGGETLKEYTAMGLPVPLAARLQASAEAGTTLIGETTCRLINHRFETISVPPMQLKGFDEPVQAYRLVQLRERMEPGRGVPGLAAPLIGRSAEYKTLSNMVKELQAGRGAIAAIVGEPGVGKSRLWAEVRDSLGDHPLSWAEGHASSQTTDQPFSVIRDLLADLLSLNPRDTPAIMDLKIERALTPLFEERIGEIWPSIALLLGAPIPPAYSERLEQLEPDALNRSMTNAFCQLVEAMANRQPMILTFDDLHWADPSSLDLLHSLFLATERVPLLIMLLFRLDREARVWELKAHAERDFGHRYQEIVLDLLSEAESQELVTKLLSDQVQPQDLYVLLREKSEGNPFFLEELIQGLIESGDLVLEEGGWKVAHDLKHVRVPETLQEVIQARIDRLQPPERSTLQAASVIGRRFGYGLLEAITHQNGELASQLLTLQRADLIRERTRLPEPVYDFKQAIVQEVTYLQLLADQRRELHRQVGKKLEEMFSDRLDEHAAIIANHYSIAHVLERAVAFHHRAGDEAFRVNANLEAAEHYTHAIKLAKDAAIELETLGRIYVSLGRALELSAQYQQALEVYQELHAVAEAKGDRKLGLQASIAQTTLQATPTPLFDPKLGFQTAMKALALAEELADPGAQAKILWNLCLMGRFTGKDADAIKYGEMSLAIAEEHGLQEQIGFTLTDLYWSYLVFENLEKSRSTIERAYSIWDSLGNTPMMADCLSGSAFLYYLCGDFDQAFERSRAAWDMSEKIDNLWGKSYSQLYIGFVHNDLGQIGQALDIMHRSIELGNQAGFVVPGFVLPAIIALIHANMGQISQALTMIADAAPIKYSEPTSPFFHQIEAQIYTLAGELDRARMILDEKANIPHAIGTLALIQPIELSRAVWANAAGEYEQALALLDEMIQGASDRGVIALLPKLYFQQAVALKALGRLSEALAQTSEGIKLTTTSGARWEAWTLQALRASLYREDGLEELAQIDCRAAAESIHYIADHAGSDELRESFLARPDVRSITKSTS